MTNRTGLRIGTFCLLAAIVTFLGILGCDSKPDAGKAKQVRMAGIIFQEDQFFRLVLFGMRDAAKKNNIELLEGNSDNRPEKEFELVSTYATLQVDAIVMSPLSRKGSVPALKQAHDKGIHIVLHNTGVDADFIDATIECSPADLGRQTGKAARKYIEEKLGGKAKVAILAFKSQASEQSDARVGGFKQEITQLPGVQVVAEQDAWLPEMAVKTAGDILTANPDIDIIYSANEGGTVGSVLAVKNAGKAGKIAVFGTDVSQQLIGFLQSEDNILQAITAQKPLEMGQLAVERALAAVKGQPIPEKKTSLNGVCLSRTEPEGVKTYAKQLAEWTAKGN